MSRSFFAGLASGYATIAVQAIVGLLLVPYLLSRHGVGLAGYGAIATIQATAAMITVALDGHRQESSRRLATWVAGGDRRGFAGLLQFTGLLVATCVALGVLAAPVIAQWLSLDVHAHLPALRLAFICIVLEQYCYLLESALHAARRSWIANAYGAADSVLRAVAVVALFSVLGAATTWFFVAALIGLACKATALRVACRDIVGGRIAMPVREALGAEARHFIHALPLALNGIAPYVVFRFSVIIGNRFLGAEPAGVLAILLVTLRTYVNQTLFSAMRPMLIPRFATSGLDDPSSAASRRFGDYLGLYGAVVAAAGLAAVCTAPIWLPLWLGDSLRPYVPYFMAAMTIYFVEIAWGVPYYCLVAYGRAHALALLSTVTAVATSLALFAAGLLELPLAAYIGCVAVYVVMYALFVRHHFRVRLQLATRTLDLQILLAAACGVVGASFVLRADRAVEVVVVATAAVATFAILSHFMASPLHRMARLLRGSARQ